MTDFTICCFVAVAPHRISSAPQRVVAEAAVYLYQRPDFLDLANSPDRVLCDPTLHLPLNFCHCRHPHSASMASLRPLWWPCWCWRRQLRPLWAAADRMWRVTWAPVWLHASVSWAWAVWRWIWCRPHPHPHSAHSDCRLWSVVAATLVPPTR